MLKPTVSEMPKYTAAILTKQGEREEIEFSAGGIQEAIDIAQDKARQQQGSLRDIALSEHYTKPL